MRLTCPHLFYQSELGKLIFNAPSSNPFAVLNSFGRPARKAVKAERSEFIQP